MSALSRRSLLLQLAGAGVAAAAAPRRPNFIVILADDLGYGDLGCYGSKTIRTPVLDRMAREGARFTNFYAGAPFCSPTRASLLTGRYPVRAGVPNVLFPTEDTGLPPEEVTFAEMLKPLGYATACVGKWRLGNLPPFRAHRQGFDFFYGLPYANDSRKQLPGEPFRPVLSPEELPLMEDDKVIEAPVNQHTLTARYTDRALRFIRDNRDRPFALYLSHTGPHTPLYADRAREGQSAGGLYGDVVEEIDRSTGRVLDALRDLGLDRNTAVVFVSDNGPRPSGKDPREAGGSTGGLRGGKGLTWEGGIRVPAIFRWPGAIRAGVDVAQVASTMDLLPTLAEWSGAPLPRRTIDGASLAGVLAGRAQAQPDRLFCYYFGAQLQAVRLGKWKLLLAIDRYPEKPSSIWYRDEKIFHRHYRLMPKPQLYDLEADPVETHDIAAAHAGVVQRLSRMAADFDAKLQRDKSPVPHLAG
jgi:arylsulfatase A-like enzyme